MAKLSKRMRVIREKVDGTKEYSINEAIALLKELATAKFVESVDVAVNLTPADDRAAASREKSPRRSPYNPQSSSRHASRNAARSLPSQWE